MNVELQKNFPLDYSATDAWSVLSNIEDVATCMPGAQITEIVDENTYKGKVSIRLGPVKMEFNGDISVQSIDAAKQQIQLVAEGTDKKGTSSASMNLTANIESGTDSNAALIGDAKVVVNGKLASFGQRMMAQVSDQILDQFADKFRAKIAENVAITNSSTSDPADLTGSETAESTAASDPSESAASSEIVESTTNSETAESAASSQATESTASAQSEPKPSTDSSTNEINGFKFLLQTIIGLIAGLFKRK